MRGSVAVVLRRVKNHWKRLSTFGVLAGLTLALCQTEQVTDEQKMLFKDLRTGVQQKVFQIGESGVSLTLPHEPFVAPSVKSSIQLGGKVRFDQVTSFGVKEDPLAFPVLFPFTFGGVILKFEEPIGSDDVLVKEMAATYCDALPGMLSAQNTAQRQLSLKIDPSKGETLHIPGAGNAYVMNAVITEQTMIAGVTKNFSNPVAIVVIGKGKIILASYFLRSTQWSPSEKIKSKLTDPKTKLLFEYYLIYQSLMSLKLNS